MESPVAEGDTVAGKYAVEHVLGRGGMGVVVAAHQIDLDRRVAIKFLASEAPPNAIDRFLREARAAALVKSEHACRVYDFGRLESGEPYIVMEYLDGSDLAEILEREGQQPVNRVVGWIVEACEALQQAHEHGMVHRDLKPANLFRHHNGSELEIKIVDFGISKMPSARNVLTSTAAVMGSPLYMSPEQLESSRDVDLRSDIWSLGVIVYELLTGKPPFDAESIVQLAVLVREQPYPALTTVRSDLPDLVERVVARCLEKRPADRYPSVAHLVADLAPLAPEEVLPIVAKLARRAGASSERSLALSPTVREAARVREPVASDLAKTFEPVQTGAPRRRSSRRLLWLGALFGALALGGVALGAVSIGRRSAKGGSGVTPSGETASASAVPVATAPTSVASASPSASSSETPRSWPAIVASAATPAAKVPAPTARPRVTGAAAAVATTSVTAATTAPVETGTPAATGAKKKRTIDRDYEP